MEITKNKDVRTFQRGLELAHETIARSENLEKAAKIAFKTIDFFSIITRKVGVAFKMLSSRLKDTVDVIESFALVGRVKELACPENGTYFLKKNTWQKCADRIFLTAAGVFKTINMAAKFTLINLGKAAKLAIGRVPVLWLIPESLVVISNCFNIWDNKNVTQKINQKLNIASNKVEKWANRSAMIAAVRAGDCETIFNLKNDYQVKVASLEREIYDLGYAAEKKLLDGKEIAKKTAILDKYRNRLELIAKDSYVELADDLAKQDIDFKYRYWSTVHGNKKLEQNKACLSKINSISKIFIINMVLTGMALGLSTAPWYLSILAAGIAVDSIGLTKALYNPTPQELPKKAIAVA